MIKLRLLVPGDLSRTVVARLHATPSVYGIAVLPGVVTRPGGDLVECYVASEDASVVIAELEGLGVAQRGAIAIDSVETVLSDTARRAEQVASGSAADAVVWESVESRTSESTELSGSFLVFMMAAALIAAMGILTDSVILIIGAMIVGPEFGPLAGLCVALVQRRSALARRSLAALVVGFPLAILGAFVATVALRAISRAPDELSEATHPATIFISEPNVYSGIVAVVAGIAGMVSLSTAKSGALVGVLVSVTTIPSAANVGVAAAYADWPELAGAAAQLIVNLLFIVVAGVATLGVQRALYARRRTQHRDQRASRGTLPP